MKIKYNVHVILSLIIVILLLPGFAMCQWLETTIWVPDSLVGVNHATAISNNSATNRVYMCGEGEYMLVIDGATGQKIARIPLSGRVTGIDCNPLRNKIYVCAEYSGIKVFDGATNQLLQYIPHFEPAFIRYNPVNDRIYVFDSSNYGHYIRVIDCQADTIVKTINSPSSCAGACFNPFNNKFYCSYYFGTEVFVFDCATDSISKQVPVGDNLSFMIYRATRNKIYCGMRYQDQIAVIDCSYDSVIRTIITVGNPGFGVYNSGTDKLYSTSEYMNTISVIDCADDTSVATINTINPRSIASDTIYNMVYCSTEDSLVAVINSINDSIIATISVNNRWNNLLYSDPLNNTLFCVDYYYSIVPVIDCSSNSVITNINPGSGPDLLTYCSNCGKIYCTNFYSRNMTAIDAATNQIVKNFDIPVTITDMHYCPAMNKLFCADRTHSQILIIDCNNDSIINVIPGMTGLRPMGYNPLNEKIYCASYIDDIPSVVDTVWVIDAVAETVIAKIPIGNRPADLCYDDDDNMMYCSLYGDQQVKAIDGNTNQVVATIPMPVACNWALAYNPINNKLYVANEINPTMVIINCTTNQIIRTITIGPNPYYVIYHPNNNMIYCGSQSASLIKVVSGSTDSVTAAIGGINGAGSMVSDTIFNRIYCCHSGDSVAVINGATNAITKNIGVGKNPEGLAFDPLYNRVFVANKSSSSISVIRDAYGIEENTAHGSIVAFLRIIPNPASKYAMLHTSGVKEIKLYDVVGCFVTTVNIKPYSAETKLELSGLHAGVYFLKAVGEQTTNVQKLVVLR
ncbi:MAG TPA: T9SS type A sorting domain-containing protein [bacterium]